MSQWLIDLLPDLSNLILVLVGFVMSLPVFAERVEKDKKRLRLGGVVCVLVGIAGIAGGIYGRHEANSDVRHLIRDDDTLVVSTNQTVSNTNNLMASIGSLVPEIDGLGRQLSDLRVREDAAKGDAKQTAILRAQLDTVQGQYDVATRKLASVLAQVSGAPLPAPTPAELQGMGLLLANEIRDWIASVSKDAPRPPQGMASASYEENQKYIDRLNSEWQTKFSFLATFLVPRLPIKTHLVLACAPTIIGNAINGPSEILRFREVCAESIEQGARDLPVPSGGPAH